MRADNLGVGKLKCSRRVFFLRRMTTTIQSEGETNENVAFGFFSFSEGGSPLQSRK